MEFKIIGLRGGHSLNCNSDASNESVELREGTNKANSNNVDLSNIAYELLQWLCIWHRSMDIFY
ncbi:hypothetical protein [Clostridium botulinum]|uniref:hypothetical protein n=1 Tax=Clostridium botulinum TaxID=1491 RepID=UPI003DA38E25